MITLMPMSQNQFDEFKTFSQHEFAVDLAGAHGISVEEALKNASEQFERLVPSGINTVGQLFYEAIDDSSKKSVGHLWLGIQDRLGKKVASINDVFVKPERRGQGFGKLLMKAVEKEAKKAGASRIRLHVFHANEIARSLYLSMGFQVSSLDMFKEI